MTKQNVLRFKLDGVEYTLKGDMPRERMERIVQMVEEKIEQIRTISPHYSAVRASTLAALQLAEALVDAEEENEQVLAEANIGGQYQYRFLPPKQE